VIAKLSGTLAHKAPGEVIIDVGGVGYYLFISLGVFYRLPEVGRSVSLFVHTHLREDALQLYGFFENEEKRVFLLLNSVAGIGPKLSINILSGIPVGDLVRALSGADQHRLVSIPGVGRKIAERMIVELRDKLGTLPDAAPMGGLDGSSELMRDAVSALVNLGYRQGDSERTVRAVVQGKEETLEGVLKEALRRLSQ